MSNLCYRIVRDCRCGRRRRAREREPQGHRGDGGGGQVERRQQRSNRCQATGCSVRLRLQESHLARVVSRPCKHTGEAEVVGGRQRHRLVGHEPRHVHTTSCRHRRRRRHNDRHHHHNHSARQVDATRDELRRCAVVVVALRLISLQLHHNDS